MSDLVAGGAVVVADPPGREDEIDFVAAAQDITAQTLGLFVRHGTGLVCAPMAQADAARLDLPPQVSRNQDFRQTAFTVMCDASPRPGFSSGISSGDRAVTLRTLADPRSGQSDIVRPGHMAPLVARPGGVLERQGHTEAAVDLMRLAGLPTVAAIVEIMDDDGSMVRRPGWPNFRKKHGLADLTVITVADLMGYRRAIGDTRPLPEVERSEPARFPTQHGEFTIHGWRSDGGEHLTLTQGELANDEDVLVRVHSECATGDAIGSMRCDCGPQLEESMRLIAEARRGVLVYLGGHEGRGIGRFNKIGAYALQDQGWDTFAANVALGQPEDARQYGAAASILNSLGVSSVRLLTNNPAKTEALGDFGIVVRAEVPLVVGANPHNEDYLVAKAGRGHTALGEGSIT